jgi:hypothetical protein
MADLGRSVVVPLAGRRRGDGRPWQSMGGAASRSVGAASRGACASVVLLPHRVGRPRAQARRSWSAGESGLERGRVGPPAAPPRWPSCSASGVSGGSMDKRRDALASGARRHLDPVVGLHFRRRQIPCCWTGRRKALAVGGEEGGVCSSGQRQPLRRWSAPSAVGGGRWGWRNKGA